MARLLHAAEKDDLIASCRYFSSDLISWCSCYNCADFHSLSDISRMVYFIYQSSSNTDLVAI